VNFLALHFGVSKHEEDPIVALAVDVEELKAGLEGSAPILPQFVAVFLAVCATAGCRSLDAIPAETVSPLTIIPAETVTRFSPTPGDVHSVDLGSILFRKTTILPSSPRLGVGTVYLQPLPGIVGWSNTWTYTGRDAAGAKIYTNESFYNGSIGVILDDEGRIATKHPLVQVRGAKKGRRWALSGGPSFIVQPTSVTSWALRYGGEREDGHRFVIVEFVDDREKDVVQDFRIPLEDARQGFSVRGVKVRVLSHGGGRITYTFATNES